MAPDRVRNLVPIDPHFGMVDASNLWVGRGIFMYRKRSRSGFAKFSVEIIDKGCRGDPGRI